MQDEFGISSRASGFYNNQMLSYLNPSMQEFISSQSMVPIAISDSKGECDCSFRAGSPGFIKVLTKKTLAYPEYKGSGVWDSLGNIRENSYIGMVFIDFFQSTIRLHVNGKVKFLENEELLKDKGLSEKLKEDMQNKGGQKPKRRIFIEVKEAYIHCSKHILLLKELDKEIHWDTDHETFSGGDFFKAKKCDRS